MSLLNAILLIKFLRLLLGGGEVSYGHGNFLRGEKRLLICFKRKNIVNHIDLFFKLLCYTLTEAETFDQTKNVVSCSKTWFVRFPRIARQLNAFSHLNKIVFSSLSFFFLYCNCVISKEFGGRKRLSIMSLAVNRSHLFNRVSRL